MMTARNLFLVSMLALAAPGCGWLEVAGDWQSRSPHAANKPPRQRAAASVVVGKDDTVWGLAQRHRLSARALIEANGLLPPYRLAAGTRLVLPGTAYHVVVKDDTLYAVSRTYDVDVYALARLNAIKSPYTIRVGQKLSLPGKGSVAPPPAIRTAGIESQSASPGKPRQQAKPAPEPRRPVKRQRPAGQVPPPPKISGKGFLWPLDGAVISTYGDKGKGLQNDGINIRAAKGASVRATENGIVAYSGNEIRGFGNLLLVKHSGGWVSAYAHNDAVLVKRGQTVSKGQAIAVVGATGSVATPQLHFELRRNRRAVDPLKHLAPPMGS